MHPHQAECEPVRGGVGQPTGGETLSAGQNCVRGVVPITPSRTTVGLLDTAGRRRLHSGTIFACERMSMLSGDYARVWQLCCTKIAKVKC